MKTFVTGATGLLGSNLVRALRAEGHSVRGLSLSTTVHRPMPGAIAGA